MAGILRLRETVIASSSSTTRKSTRMPGAPLQIQKRY